MTKPDKREKIYSFIESDYIKNGFPPSLNEIAQNLGLSAKSNIHRQIQQLVNEGRLLNLGGATFRTDCMKTLIKKFHSFRSSALSQQETLYLRLKI